MTERCRNEKAADYHRYGGRGISVHPSWLDYAKFLADMGERPPGTSIDRIDNNGNYEPGNCRWADAKTQMMNRRVTINFTIDGVTKPAKEWAEIAGIKYHTMFQRVFRMGWDPKEAVFHPARKLSRRSAHGTA